MVISIQITQLGDQRKNECEWIGIQHFLEGLFMNVGTATRVNSPDHAKSAVALTLSSPDITTKSSWHVLQNCGISDHFPIIQYWAVPSKWKTQPQYFGNHIWCVGKADWRYRKQVLIHPQQKEVITYSLQAALIKRISAYQ